MFTNRMAFPIMARVLMLLSSLALVFAMLPAMAFASPSDEADDALVAQAVVKSGTSGGCTWEVDEKYNLVIRPTNGKSGTLADITYNETTHKGNAPWRDFSGSIVSVTVKPGVSAGKSFAAAFKDCEYLTSANLASLDTSKVTNMTHLFDGCYMLKSLDLSALDTSNVTNMNGMFSFCYDLRSLKFGSIDTSRVTDMSSMFLSCRSLPSVDLTGLDTSRVTNMSMMFSGCSSLKSLDLSRFDTSKVTNMESMFYVCESLTSLDLSSFNTPNVTDMSRMFDLCTSLKSLNLGSLNTSKVTNMRYMFFACSKLTALDLSSFDTSRVTDMQAIFDGCVSLKSLDLSKFDTSKVTDTDRMISGCTSLSRLTLGTKVTKLAALPTSKVAGHTDWYSEKDKKWYTASDIVRTRLGIADTYAKEVVTMTSGGGQTWDKSSTKGATFRSSAKYADFERVRIDGKNVDGKHYTVSDGSTVVTLSPSYLTTLATGKHSIDIVSVTGTASSTFTITGTAPAPGTTVMYRMYNPNSGEHFYTASAKERDSLVKSGWRYEGEGWTAPAKSETPVYRLYSGTDHHYTTSSKERDSLVKAGWKYEGIGWYSDDAKGVPLYRQFNPNVQPTAAFNNSGSHNYTTSKKENDNLVKVGWKAEGIGWYGVK